jgi:uncharacterized membrane protein YeaQ/YmgE (transglycosylase-associated protein family)
MGRRPFDVDVPTVVFGAKKIQQASPGSPVGALSLGSVTAARLFTTARDTAMMLSNNSLLVILIVGVVAGWLAGQVVRGGGFGLIGDLVVGIIGAFIGDWLLPQLGIHLGVGLVSLIVDATIGAIVLLLILRLLTGGVGGFGGGWGRSGWGRRRW